ncbi:helix-turn-helix domain-containing protein [Sphingosinicella terrae]|uniref:helix-turn-helix domain-containing protein n=1 Tax=Sphingosinicella terrae TaxID=2172047 RepID=UPI000E0CCD12|nr:helix-turn-helix domain-containing protein [Sphingosinicella terrae]
MAEQGYSEQPESLSIGDRLRQAREAKGLTLEDVASRTRIPIRHLQHIEREEWDALPAITYCIGFVRSYANNVGLDGAELGREVRDRLGGIRSRAPAPEYYQPADPARVPPRSVAVVVAILVVVLLLGYLYWRSTLDDAPEPTAGVTLPVPESKAPSPRPAAPAPLQPQSVTGQPVTLVASEEVWVRIEDAAGGGSLFQGIMTAGQRFAVPPTAQRPVIRTGRPQVLRVAIGNRELGPLEPAERTVSNVSLRAEDLAARFQSVAPAAAPATAPAPARPQ